MRQEKCFTAYLGCDGYSNFKYNLKHLPKRKISFVSGNDIGLRIPSTSVFEAGSPFILTCRLPESSITEYMRLFHYSLVSKELQNSEGIGTHCGRSLACHPSLVGTVRVHASMNKIPTNTHTF